MEDRRWLVVGREEGECDTHTSLFLLLATDSRSAWMRFRHEAPR